MYNFVQKNTGARINFRKRYRVADDLEMYLDAVMVRCFHPHIFVRDEDGTNWCYTNDGADIFHKLVQRARCEKMSDEKGVCYMSYNEYMNVEFRTYFLDFLDKSTGKALVPMGDAASDANT